MPEFGAFTCGRLKTADRGARFVFLCGDLFLAGREVAAGIATQTRNWRRQLTFVSWPVRCSLLRHARLAARVFVRPTSVHGRTPDRRHRRTIPWPRCLGAVRTE